MTLNDLFESKLSDLVARGYQDLSDDNSRSSLQGIRKSRLTLKQIGQLRRWTDLRNAEHKLKMAQLRNQYRYIPPKGL